LSRQKRKIGIKWDKILSFSEMRTEATDKNSHSQTTIALEVQMATETLLAINRQVLVNVCCRKLKERDSVENQEVDAG